MSQNDFLHWKELCEYLDGRPGRSATKALIPNHLTYLLTGKTLKQRQELDVVFYARGWGWRLRMDWRNRLQRYES